ncbi:MAG: hypothetical protein KA116_06130 [Proteobacteria bacterium]|nr:hypothetical protein [Pseudomonadota bacterium]
MNSDIENSISHQASKADFFTSDSRKVAPNSIFVALNGQKNDGHDFVDSALKQGALAVWVDSQKNRWTANPRVFSAPDVHQVHRMIAKKFREKFQGKIVAIAGSSGKTSTKEFLFTLLSSQFSTIKTQASQNGHLGIPLSLEQLRPGIEMAVIEVGIDGPNDMKAHAEIVQPDLCVLTSIGEEHLRQLINLEGVFREERVLADYCLARNGTCFIPNADSWLQKLAPLKNVISAPNDPTDLLPGIKIEWASAVMRQNIALAIKTAQFLGVKNENLLRAIPQLSVPKGRGAASELKPGYWVIEDHYNSNPSSLKTGLNAAQSLSLEKGLSLNVVLGDMLDLGNETLSYHLELIKFINSLKIELLVLIGPEFKRASTAMTHKNTIYFNNSDEAANHFKTQILSSGVYLFKGSRGMALEKALDVFKSKI